VVRSRAASGPVPEWGPGTGSSNSPARRVELAPASPPPTGCRHTALCRTRFRLPTAWAQPLAQQRPPGRHRRPGPRYPVRTGRGGGSLPRFASLRRRTTHQPQPNVTGRFWDPAPAPSSPQPAASRRIRPPIAMGRRAGHRLSDSGFVLAEATRASAGGLTADRRVMETCSLAPCTQASGARAARGPSLRRACAPVGG
jgi:hypothetical protein